MPYMISGQSVADGVSDWCAPVLYYLFVYTKVRINLHSNVTKAKTVSVHHR